MRAREDKLFVLWTELELESQRDGSGVKDEEHEETDAFRDVGVRRQYLRGGGRDGNEGWFISASMRA